MKKILLLLFATFVASNIYSQINFGKLGTDVLVDNSIKGGISLIKSEYQLRNKKNGKLYGRGGKDVYGFSYQIGINMPTGVLVMTDIRTPWVNDSDFDKYRNNESYEPVLKTMKVFSKCESDSVLCKELLIDTEIACNNDSTIFLLKGLNLQSNFNVQIESNIKDSWIIWFSVEKGEKLIGFENLDFNTIYQKQGEDINGKDIKTPMGSNMLLGGIVVTPKITGVGKIDLQLVGLLNKESLKWKMSSLPSEFLKNDKKLSSDSTPTQTIDNPIGDDDELTPIGKNKPQEKKSKKKQKK